MSYNIIYISRLCQCGMTNKICVQREWQNLFSVRHPAAVKGADHFSFFQSPFSFALKILKLFDILVGGRRLDGNFLVRVKIGGVARAAALGSEGRLCPPVQDLLPVDRPEPAVPFDVGGAVFEVAESPRQINLQQIICTFDQLRRLNSANMELFITIVFCDRLTLVHYIFIVLYEMTRIMQVHIIFLPIIFTLNL